MQRRCRDQDLKKLRSGLSEPWVMEENDSDAGTQSENSRHKHARKRTYAANTMTPTYSCEPFEQTESTPTDIISCCCILLEQMFRLETSITHHVWALPV